MSMNSPANTLTNIKQQETNSKHLLRTPYSSIYSGVESQRSDGTHEISIPLSDNRYMDDNMYKSRDSKSVHDRENNYGKNSEHFGMKM
mgnify:CR=1 FL=1